MLGPSRPRRIKPLPDVVSTDGKHHATPEFPSKAVSFPATPPSAGHPFAVGPVANGPVANGPVVNRWPAAHVQATPEPSPGMGGVRPNSASSAWRSPSLQRGDPFTASFKRRGNRGGAYAFDVQTQVKSIGEEDIITIDCGGQLFRTFLRTLQRMPKTRMAKFAAPDGPLSETKFLFLDRNPTAFAAILEFHRSDRLEKPAGMSDSMWMEELHFYNINQDLYLPRRPEQNPMRPKGGLQMRAFDFLEDPQSSFAARIFSSISLLMVLAATVFFIAESMERFQNEQSRIVFEYCEAISIYFFTFEYVARLLACAMPFTFVTRFLNLVDLGAIIPFYVSLALPATGGGLGVLRIVRLTKVFRILRIGKYSTGLQLLLQTISTSAGELAVLGLFLSMGVMLFGTFVHMTDGDSPSGNFDSIPSGMWFALVTLTTVGYGEAIPESTAGKLVASAAICVGVLMMSGPVAVMASNFGEKYSLFRKDQQKRRDMERHESIVTKLSQMRGKQAFWKNLQTLLTTESIQGGKAVTLTSYRSFVQELFRKIDTDGSGEVDMQEVRHVMAKVGMEINDDVLERLIEEHDLDKNGQLSLEEFTQFITQAALDTDSGISEEFVVILDAILVPTTDRLSGRRAA